MPNIHGWYGDMELDQLERDWSNGDPIDVRAALQFLREARNCRSGKCMDNLDSRVDYR